MTLQNPENPSWTQAPIHRQAIGTVSQQQAYSYSLTVNSEMKVSCCVSQDTEWLGGQAAAILVSVSVKVSCRSNQARLTVPFGQSS
jgi:hypothetical protein